MRVRFWGTRGSLPQPGHSTLRYGGNTSCVEVRAADGTLVVLDKDKKPLGIVTDRDLAMKVIAEGKDPAEVKVAQVMTNDPRSLSEDMPIEEGLRMMRGGQCRRLPVVDDKGALQGLVSIDDILELLAEELSQIAKIIESQVDRRGI